jgi:hypothetical protein
MAFPRLHTRPVAAGLTLYVWMSVIQAQSPMTLETFTVPPARLPNGCQLEVPAADAATPAATPPRAVPHGSLRGNPWSGTDLQLRVAARNAVDGAPIMPYAPATARELGSFQAKWVENVTEAYHAKYESSGQGPVVVWAVRFDEAKWATPEPPLGTRLAMSGASVRLVLDAIVVRVSAGSDSECFQAVWKHLESLRR